MKMERKKRRMYALVLAGYFFRVIKKTSSNQVVEATGTSFQIIFVV